ncbi:MAG: hypothetical protein HRT72_09350 [Flavobacteriales bacterium]|nr:hypothetical protein [Flavobacteriales bacterium]
MKIKNQLILITSIILLTTSAFAGRESHSAGEYKKDHKNVQSMKVGYITNELKLSTTEAQSFWPIYNEFAEKMKGLEKYRWDELKKAKQQNEADLTDEYINKMIKMNFDTEQKILDLKLEYDTKLRTALSVKKLAKLYLTEVQFKKEMLGRIRGHHGQNCDYDGDRHHDYKKDDK